MLMHGQCRDAVQRRAEEDFDQFRSGYDLDTLDDDAVHQLRVLTKKLRAYLRVYPDSCWESVENNRAALKELKDGFADQRDYDVLTKVIDELIKPLSEERRWAVEPLRQAIERKKRATVAEHAEHSPRQTVEKCLEDWPDHTLSCLELMEGVDSIYSKARKKAKKALKKGGDKRFHEWRKRVKELVYCVPLIHDGKRIKPYRKRLKKLAKVLGNQHDLALLRETVSTESELRQDPESTGLLFELIEQKDADYRKKCKKLRKKLFAEKRFTDIFYGATV